MTNAEQPKKHLETLQTERQAAAERLDAARRDASAAFEGIAKAKDLDEKALSKLTAARAKEETASAILARFDAEVGRATAELAEAENADRLEGVRALHKRIAAKSKELEALSAKAKSLFEPAERELAALVAEADGLRSRLPREAKDLVADARSTTVWAQRAGGGRNLLAVAAEVEEWSRYTASIAADHAAYRRDVLGAKDA